MAKGTGRKPAMPVRQMTILAICRFAEPVAYTSVFPYLPEMVESFNVPTGQVAKWAGLTSAAFSLSQCLTAIPWGRASDRIGRKPIVLLGLGFTMICSILFGFSQSLAWVVTFRSLQGLSNGNVGIFRTMVAELVPQKELQPRAFSLMPLVWSIGSIVGPTFGGFLVHPVERLPFLFGESALLRKFPFALPNIVAAMLYLVGIVVGFLFLHETLETLKCKKDYGRNLGVVLTQSCSKRKRNRSKWGVDDDEADPFLANHSGLANEQSKPVATNKPKTRYKPLGYREVFSPQSNINLATYTLLAMHSVSFDQLLPIFMHHPTQGIRDPQVRLPFKFSGGFGINSGRIGVLFTIYGIFCMTVQFLAFPPLARRYGVLNVLKAVTLTFPFIYLAVPYTSLLPTSHLRQGVMLVLMLIKGWCAIFAFPCVTILLTNSASSLRILGTLNGVATSISAIGRAAGPALAGAAFTGGVNVGFVIISWWMLAAIAALAAVPAFWTTEMDGFGGGDDSAEQSDEEGEEEAEDSAAMSTTSIPVTTNPAPMAVANEEAIADEPDAVPEDVLLTPVTSRSAVHRPSPDDFDRRRAPSPIGLGSRGVAPLGARRYSSDLGVTRSGFGTGGTSYL